MDSAEFTNRFLISEVDKMHSADVQLHLLSAITHGIETAGALLDTLPFKAKGQGKKRFNLALKKLFRKEYLSANLKLDLYGQLRSHMAHCMLPAHSILVERNKPDKHLLFMGKLLHISLEQLYIDYRCAMQLLLKTLESGELKNKKIAFKNLHSLSK